LRLTKPYHALAFLETSAKEPTRMIDQPLDCLTEADAGARPLHTVRPAALKAFLAGQPQAAAAWLRETGFAAKAG
jgi:hypothetical protein